MIVKKLSSKDLQCSAVNAAVKEIMIADFNGEEIRPTYGFSFTARTKKEHRFLEDVAEMINSYPAGGILINQLYQSLERNTLLLFYVKVKTKK